ncbi:MAG TPA: alpha/beta hydrolase-fold protein [Bryobacteraceae bacterium]|nr:alpha/beta hydrolase-fold protein [Bryobacteraceae bacterium]
MRRAFGVLLAFSIVCTAQDEKKRESHWLDPDKSEPAGTKYASFSSKLAGSEVSYLLYLPPDYATTTSRRYPVVYWLHGLGGTQRTGAKFVAPLAAAIRAGNAPAMIVVLVNGMRDSLYCDSPDGKYPVESVIVKELIPHVDGAYRTIARREMRGVEGFSMGGFGAPHLGFKYPQVFGAVGGMAGVFEDVESIVLPRMTEVFQRMFGASTERARAANPGVLLEKNIEAIRGKTFIRVSVGDQDPGLERSRKAHALLERLHVPHDFDVVPGVAHNPEKLYETMGSRAFAFYQKAFAGK